MRTEEDFDRAVRDWVEVGPTELSDRVIDAARQGVRRTRQRRGPLGSWRLPAWMTARVFAMASVAVVLVVAAVAAFGLLPGRNGIGGPQPTPSATSAPSASAAVSSPVQVRFHVRSTPSAYPDAAALNAIRDIVERRLDAAGIAVLDINFDDRNTIVVDLPHGTDSKLVRSIIEPQGQLAFVPLPANTYGTSTTTGGPTGVVAGQPLPEDASLKPLFTGTAISAANPASDQTGQPVVQIELDAAASRLFADYTRDHIDEYFVIVLDGTVISAPSIGAPVTSGSMQITMGSGIDSAQQMSELVTVLRSGSLPFKLDWAGPATPPSTSP